MSGFVFNTTKSIICEPGCIEKLGELTKNTIGSSIMLVTDPGLLKIGLIDSALKSLENAGVKYELFSDVVADPPAHIVENACKQAREANIQGVIGLGGGSSMDVAKLVALIVGGGEKLENIYGVNVAQGKRLPLIQIPTTAGTGSEVTPISIITVGETEKKGVVASQLLPDVALLDANLTLGLPASITVATGIDAMVHAIEAYTSKSVNNNPISKTFALEALRLLSQNIETVVKTPENKEARSQMLLGSTMAGQAFANSPVAAVHALAYPLGGIFHVPHGLSNALMLSHVMKFNASHCKQAYFELAPYMFSELADLTDIDERVEALIEKTATLCTSLGLESTLREVGVKETDLATLAADAMKQTRLLVNNPRDVSEEDALKLYQAAF